MNFTDFLMDAANIYGLTLSDEQLLDFNRYYEMLVEWNEKMNLTAITAPQDVAVKHMIDSLSCYDEEIFSAGVSVADVGTGAGFPGLPLKIFRPQIDLTLMDSLNKRLLFLQTVTNELGLDKVAIVHARAEEAGRNKEHRQQYQIVVSRAVARLNVLSEYCLPFVRVGGYFVALKGAQSEQEVIEAARSLKILGGEIIKIKPVKLPGIDDSRAVIYIKKVANTPGIYPRRPGTPEKKPL